MHVRLDMIHLQQLANLEYLCQILFNQFSVLPHFEVTIEMDNDFILENKMQISGRVSARYASCWF